MSKKIGKLIIVSLAALLLVFTQMDVSVLAQNDETMQESSQNNTGENEAADAAKADQPQSEPVVETEQSSASVQGTRQLLGDAPTAQAAFAIFDGQDLSTNPSFSFAPQSILSSARTLAVSGDFPTTSGISNPKLEIKLNNALQLKSAPGMVVNGTNGWVMSSDKNAQDLLAQLNIVNATYTPETVNGWLTGAGSLVYEFKAGTESFQLDVQLYINTAYTIRLFNGPAETFNNVVDIRTSYTENGGEVERESTKVNNVTLTNAQNIWVSFYQQGVQYKSIGDSGQTNVYLYPYVYSDVAGVVTAPVKELTYTVKINKKIGLTNITSSTGTVSYTITPDATDTNYDYLTLTVSDFKGGSALTFHYQLPNDIAIGSYNLFSVAGQYPGYTNSVTRIDGITSNIGNFQTYGSTNVITVSDPNVAGMLTVDASNQTLAFQEEEVSTNLLGNIQLGNKTATVINNQSAELDFSAYDGVYGIEHINLMVPKGMSAKNIVVTTSLGNVYNIAEVKAAGGGATEYINFTKGVLGITSENEYISKVNWDYSGSFPAGWNAGNSTLLAYYEVSAVKYYGKILSLPANRKYAATMSLVETGNASATPQVYTQTITVNDNSILETATMGLDTNLNTINQTSGSKYNASVTTNYSNYRYNSELVRTLKGVTFYLRNTEYTTIDTSTLKITWNGNTYQASDGTLSVVEGTDNTNNLFYKIEVADITLGMGNFDLVNTVFPEASLTYQFKIKPSAPTTSILAQDMVQIAPLDQSIKVQNGGWYTTYLTRDTYNVTGQNKPNIVLAASRNNYSFNIQAKKDFLVTTAANLNDGPWVSYDFDTNQSIIDLNPSGDAKYQLAVTNNSGQTITGYTALVPIPKYGEKTDLTPANPADFVATEDLQKEAFGWTTALLEEINTSNTSLQYEVLYSTTYETDRNAASFVSWDAITDKDEIRMVKISTTDAIIDGTQDVITFPLALTDPLADAHAGNLNIYSARIYRNIDGNAGYKPSEPIAIRLKTGIVTGVVFDDTNRNGMQDTGETGHNGVSVIAYEAGTANQISSTTTQNINGVDGSYQFMGLDKNQNVDIVFGNPNTDDSTRFSPVTSGGSTPTEATDHLKATTANITPSTVVATTINAGLISPTEVTMNVQGGNTAEDMIKRYPGETIASEPAVTRDGHTFTGWFTASTGGTKVTFPYTVGTLDTTLYAQYTVNQYTLNYDVATNGGESGVPAAETINYGTKAAKPADATKTGYTFTGWFTAASAGTQWDFNTTTMPAANTTLYAQFSINTYITSFNNDGVETTADVVYGNKVAEPTTPSKEGYTFLGWYTAATGGTQWNFSTGTMPANNMTLYAQYSVNSYTLSFDIATNGGGGTVPGAETLNYGTKATKPANPTKTGYSFAGWFDAATGGNAWDFSTKTMPANNVTLYAQFSVDSYVVTFNNDGTITTETVAYGSLVSKPIDPSKLGYTFNGWFDAQTGGNEWNFSSDTMPTNNVTLYAQYTANTFTLTFDAKGGSAVTAISAATDTPINIDANVTTKDGYTFLGWYDASNQLVSGTINMYPYNTTLTAKWQGIDQTITLDVNDGDVTSVPATIVQPTGNSIDLDSVIPTRAGYSFIGWFDASDVQHSGTFAMPVGGLQLKAMWTADEQVISFNTDGGSGVDSIVAPTDSMVDISTLTTDQWSYGFKGWYDNNDVQYSGSFTMPAGGLQLQAKWQDYIADGTWTISANNFKMTYAELQAKIADGTIADSIISKSDAHAIDKSTNSDLGPLQVLNISELTSAPKAGTYQMTIAYTNPTATVSTYDLYATNERVLSTTINVEVTAENTNDSSTNGLPQSGQNITFAAFIGIILVVVAGILLVFSRSKKRL